MISKWEIYYGDETVVSSDDKLWIHSRPYNIQIVKEWDEDGVVKFHSSQDYYFIKDDTMISCSFAAIHDYLSQGMPSGALKFGRWVDNAIWERINGRASRP